MNNRVLGPANRFVGAANEVLARLCQHLNRHVVGDKAFLDDCAHEVEVGLRRRREPHLDFLVAHRHEPVEHHTFALGAHRVNQGLIAVTQVHGAPAGCGRDAFGRPRAVGQVHGENLVVRAVTMHGHRRRLLVVLHGFSSGYGFRPMGDSATSGGLVTRTRRGR